MSDTVWLQRPAADVPWGFRLSGGLDFNQPLLVQRVTAGSIAATGLNKGDVIARIGDTDTGPLTNAQANEVIKKCGNLLQLHVAKQGVSGSPGAPPPMQQQAPTRLEQQLSNMSMDGSYPFPRQQASPQQPAAPPPPQVAPGGPGYGAPSGYGPPKPAQHSPEQPPAMPDAVLNMAAKGPPEKKPWAYAPDMDSIKNQRDKVRRKAPTSNLPRYQHMLNMPDFTDPPKVTAAPAPQQPGTPGDEVDDGMYMHAQYNSPLQMYSNDNVQESFSGQTQGKVTGVRSGAPNTPNKDVVMSPTYKLIHGLDQPKPKPRVLPPDEVRPNIRAPSKDDELTFSGLHTQSDIPSRSFHRLQQQISASAEPAAPQMDSLDPQEIGNYDETSIRYRGRNIPSKSFRMLQNMTGGPMEGLPGDAESGVPIITPAAPQPDQTAVASERRRRRREAQERPQEQPQEQPQERPQERQVEKFITYQEPEPEPPKPEFDEEAYLSGNVPIVSGSTNDPEPGRPTGYRSQKPKEKAPWEKSEEERQTYDSRKDEAKEVQDHYAREEQRNRYENDEDEENRGKFFDETAFLAGKVGVFSDEPKGLPPKEKQESEPAPWQKQGEEEEEKKEENFNEDAFLAGRIPLVRGDSVDGSKTALATVTYQRTKVKKEVEQGVPLMEHFDENAFLQGKISVLGGSTNAALPPRHPRKKVVKERAVWERPTGAQDEEDGGLVTDEEYNENAFLRGKIPVLRHSVDRDLPPRSERRNYRERAPWEKEHGAEGYSDSACSSDAEFDEGSFIRRTPSQERINENGRANGSVGRERFKQAPGRKMVVLRRSVSRDRSPSGESDSSGYTSNNVSLEGEHDPDRVITNMSYKGGAIPSKTFMRLQKKMNRGQPIKTKTQEAMERLHEELKPSLDVDRAIEKIDVQDSDPNKYFEQLKKTMQDQDVKIEPEPEVTDF